MMSVQKQTNKQTKKGILVVIIHTNLRIWQWGTMKSHTEEQHFRLLLIYDYESFCSVKIFLFKRKDLV